MPAAIFRAVLPAAGLCAALAAPAVAQAAQAAGVADGFRAGHGVILAMVTLLGFLVIAGRPERRKPRR